MSARLGLQRIFKHVHRNLCMEFIYIWLLVCEYAHIIYTFLKVCVCIFIYATPSAYAASCGTNYAIWRTSNSTGNNNKNAHTSFTARRRAFAAQLVTDGIREMCLVAKVSHAHTSIHTCIQLALYTCDKSMLHAANVAGNQLEAASGPWIECKRWMCKCGALSGSSVALLRRTAVQRINCQKWRWQWQQQTQHENISKF